MIMRIWVACQCNVLILCLNSKAAKADIMLSKLSKSVSKVTKSISKNKLNIYVSDMFNIPNLSYSYYLCLDNVFNISFMINDNNNIIILWSSYKDLTVSKDPQYSAWYDLFCQSVNFTFWFQNWWFQLVCDICHI